MLLVKIHLKCAVYVHKMYIKYTTFGIFYVRFMYIIGP